MDEDKSNIIYYRVSALSLYPTLTNKLVSRDLNFVGELASCDEPYLLWCGFTHGEIAALKLELERHGLTLETVLTDYDEELSDYWRGRNDESTSG